MPNRFSRRYIASEEVLTEYQANSVQNKQLDKIDDAAGDQHPSIGVSISGWDIISSSSTIGDETQLDDLTCHLQALADHGKTRKEPIVSMETDRKPFPKKRLSTPEIVFCDAFVSLRRRKVRNEAGEEGNYEILFNARESLGDWAECHYHLGENENDAYRGVQIIKTADAKLWEGRQKATKHLNESYLKSTKSGISVISSEFNYDWTFSTPYTGRFIFSTPKGSFPAYWQKVSSSDLDMKLLTDQTQPILYFDDVNLYEDDMHDNGYSSLRCKLRVMPSCFFILLTLFVRVDHVLLRVREVRLFCKFDERDVKISRDVCWRECLWEQLAERGLQSNVRSWRIENEDVGLQQNIQKMCKLLPKVPQPEDIPHHSIAVFKR